MHTLISIFYYFDNCISSWILYFISRIQKVLFKILSQDFFFNQIAKGIHPWHRMAKNSLLWVLEFVARKQKQKREKFLLLTGLWKARIEGIQLNLVIFLPKTLWDYYLQL
jgi:hypothetical protein